MPTDACLIQARIAIGGKKRKRGAKGGGGDDGELIVFSFTAKPVKAAKPANAAKADAVTIRTSQRKRVRPARREGTPKRCLLH